MSHTESGAVVVNVTGSGTPHHKKLRKKRKQLDALVSGEKIRRKSSSVSHHDLLYSDSDDIEFGGKGSQPLFGNGGLFGIIPGTITLLVLIVTVVGLGATLKLLMTTRKDLDALHIRFNAVEASGSELPAKFHESHVRVQMIEKNNSALWASLNDMAEDMVHMKAKISSMESSLNTLEESLMGNPSLKSLPTNVAELQKSVSAFGASLQDVHTSFKVTTEEQEKVKHSLEANDKSIAYIQNELTVLHNASFLPPTISREGVSSEQPVALAVHYIIDEISLLNTAMAVLNASVLSELDASKNNQVFKKQLASFTKRLDEADKSLSNLQNLTSVSDDVNKFKEILQKFRKNLENLTNSIDVVKGVEKKLEGSQVQMATGVSGLKQQIQKIEERINALITPPSSPAPQTHEKHKRSAQSNFNLT